MATPISLNNDRQDKYVFVYSHTVTDFVQIKIGSLQGKKKEHTMDELIANPLLYLCQQYDNEYPDYYITVQLFADGRALALKTRTKYKAFTTRWDWNEWLTLPLRYCDLPPTTLLAFTIWNVVGSRKYVSIGSTMVSMFGKYKVLRKGTEDLHVWTNVEATAQNVGELSGLAKDTGAKMASLNKLAKQHQKGQMPRVDFLDRQAFRELEENIMREKRLAGHMFLQIEFPVFELEDGERYDCVYYEEGGDKIDVVRTTTDFVRIHDPDISADNLVEHKHHKLTHSLRHGPVVRELKPDPSTRDHLHEIINKPSSMPLTAEEQGLVWKFRYYLSKEHKALPKFLRYIDWSNGEEADQALRLMGEWQPIDLEGALELLSSKFRNKAVRRYAVWRLSSATDEELLSYLLQLVQALRYDQPMSEYLALDANASHFGNPADEATASNAPDLDGRGGMTDPLGGIPISTEASAPASGAAGSLFADPLGVMPVQKQDDAPTSAAAAGGNAAASSAGGQATHSYKDDKAISLASFLISRATRNSTMANFLYWYLSVEADDSHVEKNAFDTVIRRFVNVLSLGNERCMEQWRMIRRQMKFIKLLQGVVKQVATGREARPRKIERLQSMLNNPQFTDFEPFPLPLDPSVMVKGILPGQAHLFKSALMPSRVTFLTTNNEQYVTIFKSGDDLRQDQLILQMITLMDKLLRKEKIDLKLSPYLCIATSPSQGFVQFIESVAVAQVLATHGSIQAFFKHHAPCEVTPTNPAGIQSEVMDTYVRSCAGYCVITYLLGIGDRHLDNLLLTTSGHLFHIDFGFILGRDPKPFPPPMKLSKEMVEGMGGNGSTDYQNFRQHCYLAFLTLRRESNLILNLWELMVDANIGDIALEPDKTVQKVQDKFCLDMTEEQAVKFFQELIDESVSAISAVMVEQIHKWAQYWRK